MKTDDIELNGEFIDSFERIDRISDVILLGEKGSIRRIIIKKDETHIC